MGFKIDMHNIDFADLVKTINTCKGDVFLETEEGDSLNLKSKLCQMLGLSTILEKATIAEVTLRFTNKEDESRLFRFNLYQEVPKEAEAEQ